MSGCSLVAGKKLGVTEFFNPNDIGEQTVSEVWSRLNLYEQQLFSTN